MDFKDVIKQLSEKTLKIKDNLQTEEATKNALIMPFLQALGYDVFNPLEVVPEFTCDIGTKKGEKVDYAIMKDGIPVILIECKHWKEDLTLHDNQLLRYFTVSNAKFGILTNGIIYRFYSDLVSHNKMDEKPFFEFDFTNIRSNQVEELKKFHKSYFDLESILTTANELKYTNELKNVLTKEFTNPSIDFVKFLTRQVYDGTITQRVLDQFVVLVRKSLESYITDTINDRFAKALKAEQEIEKEQNTKEVQEVIRTELPEGVIYVSEDGKIITTEEEVESYFLIKSIIRNKIQPDRVYYRDSQSYFSIIIDDNNRKLICRMYLNLTDNKQIAFIGEDKKEVRYKINSIDEIYNYSDQLLSMAEKFI